MVTVPGSGDKQKQEHYLRKNVKENKIRSAHMEIEHTVVLLWASPAPPRLELNCQGSLMKVSVPELLHHVNSFQKHRFCLPKETYDKKKSPREAVRMGSAGPADQGQSCGLETGRCSWACFCSGFSASQGASQAMWAARPTR